MRRGEILALYIGNMASGKTGHLVIEVENQRRHGRKRVLAFKPKTDKRSGEGKIRSRRGGSLDAFEVDPKKPQKIIEILQRQEEKTGERFDIVVIDEVQFFPEDSGFFWGINQLLSKGYNIIAAGLALDFRGEPFGSTLWLAMLAQRNCIWLNSCCASCGKPAIFPQRIINGEPASYDSPQVAVGGEELYEPRCEECFLIPPKLKE